LDVEGAFDAIPHFLLLHKLRAHGFNNDIVNLLSSYLSSRKLRVKVNGSLSAWSPSGEINSGVPQGSILGPLLFLLYINDISDSVTNCKLYLYADDCALFLPVDRHDDPMVAHNLIQNDLNQIKQWSVKWRLGFKGSKSRDVLFKSPRVPQWRLGFKGSKSRDVLFKSPRVPQRPLLPLSLGNEVIPQGNSHKHLGVTKCNNKLNPLAELKNKVSSKHLQCFPSWPKTGLAVGASPR
jgi:hypothetical protein